MAEEERMTAWKARQELKEAEEDAGVDSSENSSSEEEIEFVKEIDTHKFETDKIMPIIEESREEDASALKEILSPEMRDIDRDVGTALSEHLGITPNEEKAKKMSRRQSTEAVG
jgi:hypothetical protein